MLARALDSNWAELAQEIGLWIPVEITNNVHDDKPEGEENFGNKPVLWLSLDTFFLFGVFTLYSLQCILLKKFVS